MKQPNRRLDFLPNKQNKYSIRKFTVGTASILVGATFMFGLSHDAQAAEEQTSSTDTAQTQSEAPKPNSDTKSQHTQETQNKAVVTPPVTTEAPASENTALHNPEPNQTTSKEPTTIEHAPQPESAQQTDKVTTPESTPTIEQPSKSNPTTNKRAKRSLDPETVEAPVNNETYSGKIIDYTGSNLVKKVSNPGQKVAPDYIDFSPKFKERDSKAYSFLTNKETVTSTKTTTTNGGSIHAYLGDYITLDDNQPEAYVYINNVGIANGHKVDALVHVKMDEPSRKFPTNKRYFFTSGRDMLSMTSQDGGGATANIKFLSHVDKAKLDDFYNKNSKGTSITSVIEGLKQLNEHLHPVSGLLNIYDLDDYDRNKAIDVRKSVTFNQNEINELYISNKPSSEATANLELKDNKIIISTGERPKGPVEDYPNRVTATFKDKSELTYSMTGRQASGTAFHVKGILLVPVQPYTVQIDNPTGSDDAKVTITQYIPTREVNQAATLPSKIEISAEFPQDIVAVAKSDNTFFTVKQNNTNKVIFANSNTALKNPTFYDKTYTPSIALKHNLTTEDITSNSEKWTRLKEYYDGNVLNVPVKWSFDNGTKHVEDLVTDNQTVGLKLSDELKNEIDKQIMAEATASVEEAKRAHAQAKTTAQTIAADQLVSKNEIDNLKNEIQNATAKKNDAQAKVDQLPERLKAKLQDELNQLTDIVLPEVNDENNNSITDDQDKLIAEAEQLLKEAQEAENKAKAELESANENNAISPTEYDNLSALQKEFETKKKAAETKIKAVNEKHQSPLIEKLNKLTGIEIPKMNDKNNNGKPDEQDEQEQQAAALVNVEDVVKKAEAADQTAQSQLQKANEDQLIKPQEYTELTALKEQAASTKKTAEDAVRTLPSDQQQDFSDRLNVLKGIVVPEVNDKNENGIPDNQDELIKLAEAAIKLAENAEKVAVSDLATAQENQAINQKENEKLTEEQKQFEALKQAAIEKANAVDSKYNDKLLQQINALKGIQVPNVNDTDNNGKPDTVDNEEINQLLEQAKAAIEVAKKADKAAQDKLAEVKQDEVISQSELNGLYVVENQEDEANATARNLVGLLPENLQAPLLDELNALDGIEIPSINDIDGNNIPDDQDTLIAEAKDLLAAVKAADQKANEELTNATADKAISQSEHDNLEKLQQDFTAKKQAADKKIKEINEKYRGDLPTELEALKGIVVPAVNDNDANGKPDDEDAKEQQESALKYAQALVEKAEEADKSAQEQLQQANEDHLIKPEEHTNLLAAKDNADTTKATADTTVKALPQDQQASLLERLDKLNGINVPETNDANGNNILDAQDALIAEAEALLKEAKAAEDKAKSSLEAANVNNAITPEEHDNLANLQQAFEAKKQKAEDKIATIEKQHQTPLTEKLNQLTGINVPEANDNDPNGKPDVEDAKEKQEAAFKNAEALVKNAEAADQAAQEKLQQAQADDLIKPQEKQDLTAAKDNADTTKASADEAVKALPSELQAPLLERLAKLNGIAVPETNDADNNDILDEQDALIEAAKLSIKEVEVADEKAKDELAKADADKAINQSEHDNLEQLQQDFVTKKEAANDKINAIDEKHRDALSKQLEALNGIVVPDVNDKDNNGKSDDIDQAELDALIKAAQASLDKAKAADSAAKHQLTEATADKLINPEEHQKLTEGQKSGVSTKAEATEVVNALPEALRTPFEKELEKLDGIIVPEINDTNSNDILDTQEPLIKAAEDAITFAEAMDGLAKTKLAEVTENQAVSPEEHQILLDLQQGFEARKAEAQQALDAVNPLYQGVLPGKLKALTGITVPAVNDNDANGKPDDEDEKIKQAALKAATELVEKAEAADQTAQAHLKTAQADQLITPKELDDITSVEDDAASTKAQANKVVNELPSDIRQPLLDRLAQLTGITVPSVNDNNENNIPDEQDKLIQEAEDLLKDVKAADEKSKDALTKAQADQAVNPAEHAALSQLQDEFTAKKEAANDKVNAIDEMYRGTLPQQLAALTGIEVPDINDTNSNGVPDDKEAELRRLVQKVIDTDKAAKDAILAIQDDGLVNPDEIESLRPFKLVAYESKMIAFTDVHNLSNETPLKAELLSVLRQYPDLVVPPVNDENNNNIPDSEDLLIRFAEAALKEAKTADQAAKDMLAAALEPNEVINPKEQQVLSTAQTEFEQKKALANEKINKIQEAYRSDLPQQLAALTGITIPDINDTDSNGIRDDVDQAIDKAKEAVEAAKAAYHNALDQSEAIQKDALVTPEESEALSEAITVAEAKKADAQAQVNALLSGSDKQALQAALDALSTIETPQVNDENHNGVPDKEDRLFDEAVKAYETAKAAETKAQTTLEEVQADGVVNPDEQAQLDALQADFKQKKELAEEKLQAVESQYRQDLPEKLQALTGISIPTINDANHNGIRDDVDTLIDKAQQLIDAAKKMALLAQDKVEKASEDGLINPSELEALSGAKNLVEANKAAAQAQIDALPAAYQKELQLQLDAINEITLPTVNDRDNNHIDDHTDALKAAVQALIDEAKHANEKAQQQLETIQQDQLITPKEQFELNNQANYAKTAKHYAQKAVDMIAESLRPEFQTQLDALKEIEIPETNDANSNGINDKQDQLISDALQAIKAAQAAENVAKVGLETALDNDLINDDEQHILSELQTAFLVQRNNAEEKVALVDEVLKGDMLKMLDALKGIEVPTVNDRNHNDVEDTLDQTLQDLMEKAKSAHQTAQEDLTKANADSLITPQEHAALVKSKDNAEKAIAQATETIQQSKVPTAVKNELLNVLAQMQAITIPTINDQNSNGISDDIDTLLEQAETRVAQAEELNQSAQTELATATKNGLITPQEHQTLTQHQALFEGAKNTAQQVVDQLPKAYQTPFEVRLNQLHGIAVPVINDQDANDIADVDDAALAEATEFVKVAQAMDAKLQEKQADIIADSLVTPSEYEQLTQLQAIYEAVKTQAKAKVDHLPSSLQGHLLNDLAALKGITLPQINDRNENGIEDNTDALINDAREAVKTAQAADMNAQKQFTSTVSDNLVTPHEQALLKSAQEHEQLLKTTAEAKVEALPSELKGNLPKLLAQLQGIDIPEINDVNANGTNDIQDKLLSDAEVAVKEAELADKAAHATFDMAVSDNLVTPQEQALLKSAQEHAQTLKTVAETKVEGLPTELKGELPELLAQLQGIDIPEINDVNANGANDIQDQWVSNAEAALNQAISANQAVQSELEKVISDHHVQSEEQATLTIAQEKANIAKETAQTAINQLPTELKGNLVSELDNLEDIEIPAVTEDNSAQDSDTTQNEISSEKCETGEQHPEPTHQEKVDENTLNKLISDTTSTDKISDNEVKQEAKTDNKEEHQDNTSQEEVSSDNVLLEEQQVTTQEDQTSEDTSNESTHQQNNTQTSYEHLNHNNKAQWTQTSTQQDSNTTQPVASEHHKALPNTGGTQSSGILVGGLAALIGAAFLVSSRRRKN